MVLTLAIPLRQFYGLEDFITMRHLENMAKVMLATGLIVAYGYVMEVFMAWYSGNPYEQFMILQPACSGPTPACYWALHRLQRHRAAVALVRARPHATCALLFVISLVVNIGMWLERFVIVVTQPAPRLPARRPGACTTPTVWDWATFLGTIGLFFTLLFLFIRFLPMISIFEMRTLLADGSGRAEGAAPSA